MELIGEEDDLSYSNESERIYSDQTPYCEFSPNKEHVDSNI